MDTLRDSDVVLLVNAGRTGGSLFTRAGTVNFVVKVLEFAGAVFDAAKLELLVAAVEDLERPLKIVEALEALSSGDYLEFASKVRSAIGDDATQDFLIAIAKRASISISKDLLKQVFVPIRIAFASKDILEVTWSIMTDSMAGTALLRGSVDPSIIRPLPHIEMPTLISPILPPPVAKDDSATFTRVESPADGFVAAPGSGVHKTWVMRNSGTTTWGAGYRLAYVGGFQMGAPSSVAIPATSPGANATVAIDIAAPNQAGSYRGYWQLQNAQGTFFGDKIWVDIAVGAAPPPPPDPNNPTPGVSLICFDCPAQVSPGQQFRPTFRATVNRGQLLGDALRGDMLRHKSGDRFGAYELVGIPGTTTVSPGQSYDFTFYAEHPVTAPSSPGTYDSVWQIWRAGGWDGPEVHLHFDVVQGNGGNHAPNTPSQVDPHDWALYTGASRVTLRARANGDPDNDAVNQYYFEIWDRANVNSGWIGSDSWAVDLSTWGRYQWHVKVRDARGVESDWSQTWNFSLETNETQITQFRWLWCHEPWGNSEQMCFCAETNAGTIRLDVNSATDGSDRGVWKTINELGSSNWRCNSDDDRPPTFTQLEYESGRHLFRLSAHRDESWAAGARSDMVIDLPTNRRPNSPSVLVPRWETYVNNRTIQFDWIDTWRTDSYRLQVATDEAMTTVLLDRTFPAGTTQFEYTFDQFYPKLYGHVFANGPYGQNEGGIRFMMDGAPPTSSVAALPAVTVDSSFAVQWSGSDTQSGLERYRVQVRDGNRTDAEWKDWQANTTATSETFAGIDGHTYYFRSSAMDKMGNWEQWPAGDGDTFTRVDSTFGATPNGADLAVVSMRSLLSADGSRFIEAVVRNQGSADTENGFYTDLYVDHLPTGVGDISGSVRFWVNSPITAGAVMTLTAQLPPSAATAQVASADAAPPESTSKVYIQTDTEGVVKEQNKANNLTSEGMEVCTAAQDAFEPDDAAAAAKPITVGQTQWHNFHNPADQDWTTVSLVANTTYEVSTGELGTTADTYVYVYSAADGSLVAANDDTADSLSSSVMFMAAVSGAYRIMVRHWNPNVMGCGTSYTLRVDEARQAQSITFAPIPDKILGVPPFTLSATASSGLAVSVTSDTLGVCSVSNSTVTLLAVGTCTMTASQPGTTQYAPASAVQRSFGVSPASPPVSTDARILLPAIRTIGPASGMQAVSAGHEYNCAITTAGALKCWGYNVFGQLGDGTTTNHLLPAPVTGLQSGVTAVSMGGDHTCALTATGGVKCWGDNRYGQLGDGTTTSRLTPVEVVGLTGGVAAIELGYSHTCALTVAGGAKCWGWNNAGQLGDGSTANRSAPVDVVGLTSGVSAVSAAGSHTCALTTAGGVKCWGYNVVGQLGDGTTTDKLTPVAVSGLNSGVQAIGSGGTNSCALTTGGGLKCWGSNYSGQLGDGTRTDRWTPVDVSGLTSGVRSLAVGWKHICALTTAGGVKCWGFNTTGGLGDGTTTDRWTPVNVSGLASGVVAVSAGGNHTCALTTANGLKCWGGNQWGQLGDATTVQRLTPVDVLSGQ